MKISPRGIELIKRFEGLRLKAYKDAGGVLTIGYGHTGPDVKPGLTIDREQAEALLRKDLARFEAGVRRHAAAAGQDRFDALVSFAFNVGLAAFARSTLLRKHKAGDFVGAADQFPRWIRAGGRVLPGLKRRRAAERALYEGKG
jgi:lysozyme